MIKTILILILIGSGNLFANTDRYYVKCKINIISETHPRLVSFFIFRDNYRMGVNGEIIDCDDLGSYDDNSSYLICANKDAKITPVYEVNLYHSLLEVIVNKRKYRCEYCEGSNDE